MITKQHAVNVIGRINLVGGRVEANPGDFLTVVVQVWIEVRERGGHAGARPTRIGMREVMRLSQMLTEDDVLRFVQQIWTSLWMHESLETFVLQDQFMQTKLPFNPHCPGSVKPMPGEFLLDENCEILPWGRSPIGSGFQDRSSPLQGIGDLPPARQAAADLNAVLDQHTLRAREGSTGNVEPKPEEQA